METNLILIHIASLNEMADCITGVEKAWNTLKTMAEKDSHTINNPSYSPWAERLVGRIFYSLNNVL